MADFQFPIQPIKQADQPPPLQQPTFGLGDLAPVYESFTALQQNKAKLETEAVKNLVQSLQSINELSLARKKENYQEAHLDKMLELDKSLKASEARVNESRANYFDQESDILERYGGKAKLFRQLNPDGTISVVPVTPFGEKLSHGQNIGVDTKTANDISTARKAYNEMALFRDRIHDRIAKFQEQDPQAFGLWQAGFLKLNSLTQQSPAGKAFREALTFEAAQIDKKTIGSVRVGGQKLIEATRGAIWSDNDNSQTTEEKLNNFVNMGIDTLKATYNTYGVPYPDNIPGLSNNNSRARDRGRWYK